MEHTLTLEEGDTLVVAVKGYKDKLTLGYDHVLEALLQSVLSSMRARAYPEMAQAQLHPVGLANAANR